MIRLLLVITVAFSVIISADVSAAQDGKRPIMRCEKNFVDMDKNKDGKISLEEFSAVKHPCGDAEDLFKQRDADKDGFLTKEEFCSKGAMRGKRRGKAN
ncbi:MAG: EF-hand domain-containing protein [Deltaproteobacteria bacterium]|nr:EF-hand domain-containing protein [Deltaproteobacteria bacterium]